MKEYLINRSDTLAFPLPNMNTGMTLRDYFAAKAMTAVAFHFQDRNNEQNCRHTAAHAYLMADAMMEAREA